jgi:phosphatidylglycerophosphate synthase
MHLYRRNGLINIFISITWERSTNELRIYTDGGRFVQPLYTVENNKFFFTVVLLVFRYLADCLDGGTARKYNKTSKIGGALDTFSDNLLIFIYVIIICNLLNIPGGISAATFFVILNLYMMSLSNSLINHSGIKFGGNSVKNIYAFFINNSYILFIFQIATIRIGMYGVIEF